jgi:23S rRNA pseudouridine1911/1915/1917 synthase
LKKSNFILEISAAQAGQRIDKVLGLHSLVGSRSKAEHLIGAGLVKQFGKPVKASHKTSTGESFEVEIPATTPSTLLPLDLALETFFEDQFLMVINKPAGLVVHPAAGHAQDTLVNALMNTDADFEMQFGENRPGIVHRLDKDTSGLLVVAKTSAAQEGLVAQFKARSVHRRYQALVMARGLTPKGSIQSYLGRHPGDRKRFASLRDPTGRILRDENLNPATGKWARTHYETVARLASGLSLLTLKLETGRTHQIRVHMSEAGAPIVGDPVYLRAPSTSGYSNLEKAVLQKIPRLALHAFELGFIHPNTGRSLSFRTDWPQDLRGPLTELGLWRNPDDF